MAAAARKSFHNYLKLRELLPVPAWAWALGRNLSIAATLAVAALLFIRPQLGLLLFWKIAVPVLPAVFLLAPGLWRNLCPLAASNQTPRRAGRTAQGEAPAWWKEYGYVIGFGLFFALATSRKFLFNHDGPATALLVLSALAGAFVGGWFLKGKSGWCSSVCPLYPVQRLYNQTPFLIVANAHCDPCLGCTKNCYDFNPMAAQLADLHEEDRYYVGYRRLFAYCMPGFVVGYFTLPDPPAIGIPALFGAMLLHMAASSGIFLAAESLLKTSLNRLVSLAAAAAILSFYLLGFGKWLGSASDLFGLPHPAPWVAHAGTAVFALVLLLWLARTRAKEKRYLRMISRQREQATVGADATTTLRTATASAKSEIRFEPSGKALAFQAGKTLLEIAESGDLPIQSGCRMGACGADPVRILEGEGNLSPMGADERATLERLGLGDGVRLACACRPKGGVSVSLDPRSGAAAVKTETVKSFDRGIRSVVVLGNGVAGTTAADHVRKLHPECEIHLVAKERHPLYNRMGIEKLVHGRTAMEGLYLQPESWHADRRITPWLNTRALRIDRDGKKVVLATGEELPWDRLVLATGSDGAVPDVPGWGLPGSFVLRDADQAMGLRAFVQEHGCRAAAVAGGGLLGLEAAHALARLGMKVRVLERGDWLLRRQLDATAGRRLAAILERMGLEILVRAETAQVLGDGRVAGCRLTDGRELACDVLLAAVGIRPNVELAREAGLEVAKGVVVDERLRTSASDIWAAGDVCEYRGEIPGLWPTAAEQGRIAARNALGAGDTYDPTPASTALKVAGIDLLSIGKFSASLPGEREIVPPGEAESSYRKLVVGADGKLLGGILLEHPESNRAVATLARRNEDLSSNLDLLENGDWSTLDRLAELE